MKIYAIGDLHLSGKPPSKPMEIFGEHWADHAAKVATNWHQLIRSDDTVIICGDMNVAHREIDLKNPKTNVNNAGFTPQERGAMTKLLESGFVDTFRYLYPDAAGRYSWWSYMFNARANNAGWRIDYFLVSDRIKNKIIDARIDDTVLGSDHCPVVLEIDL